MNGDPLPSGFYRILYVRFISQDVPPKIRPLGVIEGNVSILSEGNPAPKVRVESSLSCIRTEHDIIIVSV